MDSVRIKVKEKYAEGRKEMETAVQERPAPAHRDVHRAETDGECRAKGFDDDDLNPETHQLSDFKELCKSVASLLHIGEFTCAYLQTLVLVGYSDQ